MATTSIFKSNSARYRVMTTESAFASGMQYTNAPIAEGFVKSLVNYDVINSGAALRPRAGFVTQDLGVLPESLTVNSSKYSTHSSGLMYVQTFDESDTVLCRYTMFGTLAQPFLAEYGDPEWFYDLHNTKILLEFTINGITRYLIASSSNVEGVYVTSLKTPDKIHDTIIDQSEIVNVSGVCTCLESNIYMPVRTQDGLGFVGSVKARFNADYTTFTWSVQQLVPKEITPTQAVNCGYNMLKNDPYDFVNKATATGGITLTGILPRDADDKLMLSARPGSVIYFHLIYEYPTLDKTNGKKYYVQWEIQDLNSMSDPVTLQQVRKSPTYTPGDDVYVKCTSTTFKQFTIIAKIYYKDVVDATTYNNGITQELGDTTYLLPDQVITFNSYTLTNDNNTSTLNLDPVTYDIATASGMCSWMNRLVLWGIAGARSTLFVSDINRPEYIPYPNNSEIFDDDIVACTMYLTNLLVFTRSKLYMLTMNTDGLTYTVKCIQDRLSMTENDMSVVKAVQNMVYFKSGNYFYMIVPKSTSTTGELQTAPITTPIEFMLDNFTESVQNIFDDVYNLNVLYQVSSFKTLSASLKLIDYHNYLENKQMRNVYKFAQTITKQDNTTDTLYIDVVLQYDTVLRTWLCYMYESTAARMIPFEPTVTNTTRYISLYKTGNTIRPEIIKTIPTSGVDAFTLDGTKVRVLNNVQFIDTGYRKHAEQIKKRFREVQIVINNTTQSKLEFNTGFVVDDDTRKQLYTYDISHDIETGVLFIDRNVADPEVVQGATKLNSWELDFSKFPNTTVVKVRFNVTGKGYGGSVKVLCTSQHMYELLNMTWIYRMMYGR